MKTFDGVSQVCKNPEDIPLMTIYLKSQIITKVTTVGRYEKGRIFELVYDKDKIE